MAALIEILDRYAFEGAFYEKIEGNSVGCFACAHRCRIKEGSRGVCKVRFNRGGLLFAPFGYTVGTQCDPVEKKPFFHVLPGASAFSFGMLGCNMHCGYCQNWATSQALRDPGSGAYPMPTDPKKLIETAHRSEIVVSTYNEPLITSEWALAVFMEAKAAGFMTAYVSNGYATPEALDRLHPWLDLFKIDLKCFNDSQYRLLGGRLQPVLDTIRALYGMGIWVEIVTLLVPGFNDSKEELTKISEFLCSVSPDIPWHITAFHRDYKMADFENTASEDLRRAVEIGLKSGLRYVYAGNQPGRVGNLENTCCPHCRELLVERCGYRIQSYRLASGGRCPSCGQLIPGRWRPDAIQ